MKSGELRARIDGDAIDLDRAVSFLFALRDTALIIRAIGGLDDRFLYRETTNAFA